MSAFEQVAGILGKLFKAGVFLSFCAAVAVLLLLMFGKEGLRPDSGDAQSGGKAGGGGSGEGLFAELVERVSQLLPFFQGEDGENSAGYQTVEGTLEEAGTDLRHSVQYKIVDGFVFYRLWLEPYEEKTHQLMQGDDEALFVSFHDAAGRRLLPESAADRIAMRSMRAAMKDKDRQGWYYDGRIPMKETDADELEAVKVGWIFSPQLHAYLRSLREYREGERASGAPVAVK